MNWKFWTWWAKGPQTLSLAGRLRIVEDFHRRGHYHLAVTEAKSALCGALLHECPLKLADWMVYQNEQTFFCGSCEGIQQAVRRRQVGG